MSIFLNQDAGAGKPSLEAIETSLVQAFAEISSQDKAEGESCLFTNTLKRLAQLCIKLSNSFRCHGLQDNMITNTEKMYVYKERRERASAIFKIQNTCSTQSVRVSHCHCHCVTVDMFAGLGIAADAAPDESDKGTPAKRKRRRNVPDPDEPPPGTPLPSAPSRPSTVSGVLEESEDDASLSSDFDLSIFDEEVGVDPALLPKSPAKLRVKKKKKEKDKKDKSGKQDKKKKEKCKKTKG